MYVMTTEYIGLKLNTFADPVVKASELNETRNTCEHFNINI